MMDQGDLCAGGTLRAAVWTAAAGLIDYQEQPVDSYLIQWVQLLAATGGDRKVAGTTDTSGTDHTLEGGGIADDVFRWDSVAGNKSEGMVIGTGSTDEAIDDNSLGAKVTTDWSYGSTDTGAGQVSGSSGLLDITRTFGNHTGQAVDINEVGLVAEHDDDGGTVRRFLCIRDTGDPITTVDDGQNVTFEYELEFQV